MPRPEIDGTKPQNLGPQGLRPQGLGQKRSACTAVETLAILSILNHDDMVPVRTAVRKAALSLSFGLVDQTKLVTAASELARNTLTHGRGGEVRIERVQGEASPGPSRAGLRLIFSDRGPGIANLELALTDGWSSADGMGLGLSGTRRLMDEFDVASKVGEGTTVTITKWSR